MQEATEENVHCLSKRIKQVCTTSVNIANKVCTFFRQSHFSKALARNPQGFTRKALSVSAKTLKGLNEDENEDEDENENLWKQIIVINSTFIHPAQIFHAKN